MLNALCSILLCLHAHQDDPKAGKTLVWDAQFTSFSDLTKDWDLHPGKGLNKELEYYTKSSENVSVQNGALFLTAKREPTNGADYSSGRVESRKTWTYGYFEVKAKIPGVRGTWPAIWMLGDSTRQYGKPTYIPWPECGEIDIMEAAGWKPDSFSANVHTTAHNFKNGKGVPTEKVMPGFSSLFHIYGLNWQKEKLDIYLDGTLVKTYANEHTGHAQWPFDDPCYMILNLAVGGSYGGVKGVDDSSLPTSMEVDYVHVYQ